MVCSFMFFVLPMLLMRCLYGFWGWLTGRKVEAEPEPTNADERPAAAKGTCPYHVVLRFFGFKVPEKKA